MKETSGYPPPFSLEQHVQDVVVDTNVLLTFFWKKSVSRRILPKREFNFFSPQLALEEINSHKSEILKKIGISEEEFQKIREELAMFVEFIPLDEYSKFLQKASCIPDKGDIDFIALALKLSAPIWSNDKELKKQSLVQVFNTQEFIKKFLYTSFPNEP